MDIGLSGHDYTVATLSKLYLTKELTVTDGRTDPNYRKASLLIRLSFNKH